MPPSAREAAAIAAAAAPIVSAPGPRSAYAASAAASAGTFITLPAGGGAPPGSQTAAEAGKRASSARDAAISPCNRGVTTKPSLARRTAGATTCAQGNAPNRRCSSKRPAFRARPPAARGPMRERSGTGFPSAPRYIAAVAAAGAVSRKSSAAGSPWNLTTAKPPPPRLPASGWTTASASAVATALALAVVHPEAGNLGGGGFAVVRFHGEPAALDFRETAPAAATAAMYLGADGKPVPDRSLIGPLAAGVPGSPAGLFELHRRFGALPWAQVVAPAVRLARDGFVVTPRLHGEIAASRALLARFPASAAVWLPGGAPPPAGSVMKVPALAAALAAYAERGDLHHAAGRG